MEHEELRSILRDLKELFDSARNIHQMQREVYDLLEQFITQDRARQFRQQLPYRVNRN